MKSGRRIFLEIDVFATLVFCLLVLSNLWRGGVVVARWILNRMVHTQLLKVNSV